MLDPVRLTDFEAARRVGIDRWLDRLSPSFDHDVVPVAPKIPLVAGVENLDLAASNG